MTQAKVKEWVCTALEIEDKGQELYKQAMQGCPEAMGRDVFKYLYDDAAEHKSRINDIYQSLQQGEAMEQACSLPEEQEGDIQTMLNRLVDRYPTETQVCYDTKRALQMGIDYELSVIRFYEKALQQAESKEERRFLRRMVQEERAHYILLSDLNYYYEDPEGVELHGLKPQPGQGLAGR